jgi:glycerophosphoryl diester phosphodiesterase
VVEGAGLAQRFNQNASCSSFTAMAVTRRRFSALSFAAALAAGPARAQSGTPLVIARGGPDGGAPRATKAAYELAIRAGADFIYADLIATKDSALIARPDNELSASTDVASRAEFAGRRTTKTIDGAQRSGWFCEDFTLAEIKTLVCVEPGGRGGRADAKPAILTFQEVTDVARAGSVRAARVVGVYAGLVRPAYFTSLNLALEPLVASAIENAGYNSPAAAMFVTSLDAAALKSLAGLTRARRVQRMSGAAGDGDAAYLAGVHAYAQGVAPDAALLASGFCRKAHAAGLFVHAWAAPVDSGRVKAAAFAAGADGVCAEFARDAVRARGAAMKKRG